MANVLHPSNVLVIDNTASGAVIDGRVAKINTIKWRGATTAGHTAVLTDQAGNHLWADVAAGANYVSGEYKGGGQWNNGIKCPTLASGIIDISFQ